MKINEIDKDFEDIIYYLDKKGFKPFASCDGVIANHKEPKDVGNAYVAFLKSSRILEILAIFLNKSEEFQVAISSADHLEPQKLYGNIIEGTTYLVFFFNKDGSRTEEFKNMIKETVEGKRTVPNQEKKILEVLERTIEENTNSDLGFQVTFHSRYQSYMCKSGKINELYIHNVVGEERREGNISITTQRDMSVLAELIVKRYGIPQRRNNPEEEYPEAEFVIASNDKSRCYIYFTDEHFGQILEQIQYIKKVAHTLPTFKSREWVGSDEELWKEYYDEMALQKREERLQGLEEEAKWIFQEERKSSQFNTEKGQTIGE